MAGLRRLGGSCGVARECISLPTVAFHCANSFLTLEALRGGDDPVGVFNRRPFGVPVRQSPYARSDARRARARGRRVLWGLAQRDRGPDAVARRGGRLG